MVRGRRDARHGADDEGASDADGVTESMGALSLSQAIPRFYFPRGTHPKSIAKEDLTRIRKVFSAYPSGMRKDEFVTITKNLCGLPSFFNAPLFEEIDLEGTGVISMAKFSVFWKNHFQDRDVTGRFFQVVGKSDQGGIVPADFLPFMEELLIHHPGLAFLEDSPEFQDRYVETVIARIFYHVNVSGTMCITEGELRRSNLVDTFNWVDEEEDINLVFDYFSYEHFYVIYCNFFELDEDHDFLIGRDELASYANYSLTNRVIDRIFKGCARPLTSGVEGKMSYEDFLWFLLSEEDKRTETALRYWFGCLDLDHDGVLSLYEIQYFWEEQAERLEMISPEAIPFPDILCQLLDAVHPQDVTRVGKADLRASKCASVFFNTLINVNKFWSHEIMESTNSVDEEMSDWDRFAQEEYERFTQEDDGDE